MIFQDDEYLERFEDPFDSDDSVADKTYVLSSSNSTCSTNSDNN